MGRERNKTQHKMDFREKAVVFSQETTMHGVQYVGKENTHWFRRLVNYCNNSIS